MTARKNRRAEPASRLSFRGQEPEVPRQKPTNSRAVALQSGLMARASLRASSYGDILSGLLEIMQGSSMPVVRVRQRDPMVGLYVPYLNNTTRQISRAVPLVPSALQPMQLSVQKVEARPAKSRGSVGVFNVVGIPDDTSAQALLGELDTFPQHAEQVPVAVLAQVAINQNAPGVSSVGLKIADIFSQVVIDKPQEMSPVRFFPYGVN